MVTSVNFIVVAEVVGRQITQDERTDASPPDSLVPSRRTGGFRLYNLEPPQALAVHHEVVIGDSGAAVDPQCLGVAIHDFFDVAALQFNVPELVERPGAGGVVRTEAFALNRESLLEVGHGQIHLTALVVDLANVVVRNAANQRGTKPQSETTSRDDTTKRPLTSKIENRRT